MFLVFLLKTCEHLKRKKPIKKICMRVHNVINQVLNYFGVLFTAGLLMRFLCVCGPIKVSLLNTCSASK